MLPFLLYLPQLLKLRQQLWQQQTCNHSYVIGYDAPQHFRIKMLPALPVTAMQVKPALDVRYHGLDPATPLLQPCFHIAACHYVLQGAYDLIKHNIDHSSFLSDLLVLKRSVAPIGDHITQGHGLGQCWSCIYRLLL